MTNYELINTKDILPICTEEVKEGAGKGVKVTNEDFAEIPPCQILSFEEKSERGEVPKKRGRGRPRKGEVVVSQKYVRKTNRVYRKYDSPEEKLDVYRAKYRANQKRRMKLLVKPVHCPCGSVIKEFNVKSHQKTKKHKKYLENKAIELKEGEEKA